MKRYKHLLQLIDLFQPKTIVEVGTFDGGNAVRMIKQAQQYHEVVTYYGFDLFEDATPETDSTEFNVKPHHYIEDVLASIESQCRYAEVILTKGNTRETLKPMRADFAFIDGGHSYETIRHDHKALIGCSVIVHDDYYTPDENGNSPELLHFGCNDVVVNHGMREGKPVLLLPSRDPVKGGGYTQLVLTFGGA